VFYLQITGDVQCTFYMSRYLISKQLNKKNVMKLKILIIVLAVLSTILSSCNLNTIENESVSQVTKNDCGLLVFKDSVHYQSVYDYLETMEEVFETTTTSASSIDEEKPLSDFELLKNHFSYRNHINSQEDNAENNGIDLSVNPVFEILDDDAILQTLLSKDRMLVIENTVYFYFDDCTLFKFPVGNCDKNIGEALNYFKNYNNNVTNNIKPVFNFEKIDICNDEENYKAVEIICQEIELEYCASDPCKPQIVDFFMSFPGYFQSIYYLTGFKYQYSVKNSCS